VADGTCNDGMKILKTVLSGAPDKLLAYTSMRHNVN